jgi:drug/metabolite transporter (DMT)-like permease
MTAHTRWLVFLESFLGNFLFSICMLFGVSMTSAVSAGVIMASIPAVVAVASWLFLRERITVRIGLAIACAALGIGLLALSPAHAPASPDAACSRRCRGSATCWCSARCCARPPMR